MTTGATGTTGRAGRTGTTGTTGTTGYDSVRMGTTWSGLNRVLEWTTDHVLRRRGGLGFRKGSWVYRCLIWFYVTSCGSTVFYAFAVPMFPFICTTVLTTLSRWFSGVLPCRVAPYVYQPEYAYIRVTNALSRVHIFPIYVPTRPYTYVSGCTAQSYTPTHKFTCRSQITMYIHIRRSKRAPPLVGPMSGWTRHLATCRG